MPAFSVKNCHSFEINDCKIQGSNVGVESINSNITARNVGFKDVAKPWDIKRGDARVSDTTIEETASFKSRNQSTSVGWVPSAAPAMPARCKKCGTVFPSKRYNIWNAKFYGHNNAEVCPICGNSEAQLADGAFEATSEIVKFILGPEISKKDLEIIQSVSQEYLKGHISVDDVVSRMDAIDRNLGEKLSRLKNTDQSKYGNYFLTAVLIVMGALADWDPAIAQIKDLAGFLDKTWELYSNLKVSASNSKLEETLSDHITGPQ